MDTFDLRPAVLIVDDDEAFVRDASRALANAGYAVRMAVTYFDALDLLDRPEIPIDALITDVLLDKGNGFALARVARFHRKRLKAIYVTAYDIASDEAIGPVLRKPVAPEALVDAVRAAVGVRQADCA
ncbi:MAG: response regulator [Gemmatimonas sp.]